MLHLIRRNIHIRKPKVTYRTEFEHRSDLVHNTRAMSNSPDDNSPDDNSTTSSICTRNLKVSQKSWTSATPIVIANLVNSTCDPETGIFHMIQGTNCSVKLGRPSLKESRTSDELDLSIKIILPKAKKDCAGKVHILLLELKGDS